MFKRAGRLLGLPVSAVREVLPGEPATPVPLAPAHVAGVISLRGEPLSLVQIDQWIGTPGRRCRASDQILVIETNRTRIGVVVDCVFGVEKGVSEEGAAETMGPLVFRHAANSRGALLILDPVTLVDAAVSLAHAGLQSLRSSDRCGESPAAAKDCDP